MRGSRRICFVLAAWWSLGLTCAIAEDVVTKPDGVTSIEEQRETALREYREESFPDLQKVREQAKAVLGRPIEEQTDEELEQVATDSNKVANLIGFIQQEYDAYYRENHRYDFIQKKVAGPHDAYVAAMNEFKQYRNQAYFNRGVRAKGAGDRVSAFFFFRDAYRLSTFDCGPGALAKDCLRWRAEQELQGILGLGDIKAFVSWK